MVLKCCPHQKLSLCCFVPVVARKSPLTTLLPLWLLLLLVGVVAEGLQGQASPPSPAPNLESLAEALNQIKIGTNLRSFCLIPK